MNKFNLIVFSIMVAAKHLYYYYQKYYSMRIQFYIYILSSKRNTVLYIGVTKNLRKRAQEHKMGTGSKFTKHYCVNKLVHYEHFNKITDAIRREKQLKNWAREWKNNLINKNNSNWQDLYESL